MVTTAICSARVGTADWKPAAAGSTDSLFLVRSFYRTICSGHFALSEGMKSMMLNQEFQ
jgi:hypothetical protein